MSSYSVYESYIEARKIVCERFTAHDFFVLESSFHTRLSNGRTINLESVKFNEELNEEINIYKLSSGIKCYIIPKKGYAEKQALICTNYGSVDNSFTLNGKSYLMPEGIAHFLEHKLFENEKINIFDTFINQGAGANAFTSYTATAYYFNCVDRFEENLRLLLKFTEEPYFTDANVEKEKGIIAQEINMYSDNPFWRVVMNMHEAMYEECPIKNNIAGTVKSIADIKKEDLYQCYEAFYHPANMAVICVGELNPRDVAEIVESHVKARSPEPVLKRFYGKEKERVLKSFVEKKMPVARPMFNFGFKESGSEFDLAERTVGTKIIMDIITGESSGFFNKLYDEGIVDGPFHMEYVCGEFFGTAVFGCTAEEPSRACELLLKEIDRVRETGIEPERFEQIRRKHLGRFIRGFNVIDNISPAMVDLFSKGLDLIDLYNVYEGLTPERLTRRVDEIFREDNHVLSVIKS